jgi:hypothetical protein
MIRYRSPTVVVSMLALVAPAVAQIERPIPYPLTKPRGWDEAVAAGTRTETGVPGPNYWTNYARYTIRASLEPTTAKVQGHVEVTYENRSPHDLRELAIHLYQNAHKAGNLRNRYLEITGGVTVANVTVDGEPLPDAGRGQRGDRRGPSHRTIGTVMTLTLPEPLRSGDSVVVAMEWEYQVPKRGAPRNGHDDFHTYYLGYWYPQIAVFEDVARDFVADQYLTNAEFYMGYADYDVEFTAPKGWLVRATGELGNPENVLTDAARERLAAALAGRDIVHVITKEDLEAGRVTRMDRGDALTWRYRARNVRDVAVSISDRYVWDATHAVVPNRDGDAEDGIAMIHAVYRPEGRGFERSAEYARHTIEHMSKHVYPYPWPHMTVCGGVIGGGMEFPMMTICGSGGLGLVAHELIHMWFPMLVGSNEKAHAWQDEGFTDFFTDYVTAAFSQREPAGRRGIQGYLGVAARGEIAPLMTHGDYYPAGGRGDYGFASYTKSSAILLQLRDLIGEDVFFAAFRKYVADWAHKHPLPQDFFNAFGTAAGRDLDWYFRTWYFETWTLDQAVEAVTELDGGTDVVVADLRYATYPTIVAVTYADGRSETQSIDVAHWLAGKKTKTLRFGPGVARVELNPDRVTLDLSARNHVWERQ